MEASLLSDLVLGHLNRAAGTSLQQQLYRALQQAIHAGVMRPGYRLPSSRGLAKELNLSRITVMAAYDMLAADGYLASNIGSGTYVADPLPVFQENSDVPKPQGVAQLSSRGADILRGTGGLQEREGAFLPGVPDSSEFPFRIWQRLCNRYLGTDHRLLTGYVNGGGYLPLRRALADYLRVSRGVRCAPEQVIVTMGTQQSLDLAIRMLTDVGDVACIETPSHWGTSLMLRSAGLRLMTAPVDDEGIKLNTQHFSAGPKLVFITPSHQFPMGATLSNDRRRQLLHKAAEQQFWVLEDDYDSEFRYSSAPLPSLQGSDTQDRTIFLGTFSKVMFPGMRLSYMVVPTALVDAFTTGLMRLYRPGHLPLQAAMADFLLEGHFARHIRRMRGVYAERRAELSRCLLRTFGTRVVTVGGNAGLHLTIRFRSHIDIPRLEVVARRYNVLLRRLASFDHDTAPFQDGFVLGYGTLATAEIAPAVERLAQAYQACLDEQASADELLHEA